MSDEDRIAKLVKIWVEWNNPIVDKISGDDAMYQIGNLFKTECLIAWREFVKQKRKHDDLALRIKHEMVR
jgi:hypothetical protein